MSEYKMPKLGADMEDAILLEWKVKVGDRVQKGDIIAEIETVKGDIDVEVFEDGIVEKIIAQPGQKLPVGTVLAYINSDEKEAPKEEPPVTVPPMQDSPSPKKPEKIPPLEEPIREPGPEEFSIRKDPETEPIPEEIPTPLQPPSPVTVPPPDRELKVSTFRHIASPLARRMADDLGIDLQQVKGSGEGGIIHKKDIEGFLSKQNNGSKDLMKGKVQRTVANQGRATIPASKKSDKMRQAIAAAMSRSNSEIPHYYLEISIDMSTALNWLKEENLQRSVQKRLLPAVLLLKATALSLKKTPSLNAYWIDKQLQTKSSIHIGFAVSLRTGGLVIPAIHDVDKKSLSELMDNLSDVSNRARTGKLKSSELTDGTITISNIGDRGVDKIFGVIYPPQVAIVGFGKIKEKPWAENGMLDVRPVLNVTLAADHRASDGRIGAQFLEAMNKCLQKPEELI